MLTDREHQQIAENWQQVQADVARAAEAAGRSATEITIIGVSKYVDSETTRSLIDAGCHALGESRPQSLVTKAQQLQGCDVQWHLIGTLQRNKSRRVCEVADVIHSIDSLRLLQTVQQHAADLGRQPRLLLEVNISREAAKHGFEPAELLTDWEAVMASGSLPIVGLMGMAGLEATPHEVAMQFESLRSVRDQLQQRYEIQLPELSMGMSGDFEIAIAQGATMVRIGSRLFTGLDTSSH